MFKRFFIRVLIAIKFIFTAHLALKIHRVISFRREDDEMDCEIEVLLFERKQDD